MNLLLFETKFFNNIFQISILLLEIKNYIRQLLTSLIVAINHYKNLNKI